MPDRVIKGLQNLRDAIATDYIHEADQAVGTIEDAIALLKEQEAVEPKQVDLYGKEDWYGLVCVCPDCKAEWMSDEADTHFCPKCGRKAVMVMTDREKTIKDIEECLSASCRGFRPRKLCPYNDEEWDIMRDALALLKEQEVKTGYWIDSAGNDKCSICGTEYSDLYPDYGNTHFCPNCGAKMEGR